jgi:hypothetical protein
MTMREGVLMFWDYLRSLIGGLLSEDHAVVGF